MSPSREYRTARPVIPGEGNFTGRNAVFPSHGMRSMPRSGDNQLAAHALVPLAAEDVAEEGEGAGLVRRERELHRLARHDVAAHAEIEIGRASCRERG